MEYNAECYCVIVRGGRVLRHGKRSVSGLRHTVSTKRFRNQCALTLKSDASAAIAIASRRGLGKVRHIEVCQLWLQEKARSGEVKVVKVGTDENVTDSLTKYVSNEILKKHMRATGQFAREGRHRLAPATER